MNNCIAPGGSPTLQTSWSIEKRRCRVTVFMAATPKIVVSEFSKMIQRVRSACAQQLFRMWVASHSDSFRERIYTVEFEFCFRGVFAL